MSMSQEELTFLQHATDQIQALRIELAIWQRHAGQIEASNVQLAQQVAALNKENVRLSEWVEQTFKVVQRAQQARQAELGQEPGATDLVSLLSRTLSTFKV